MGSRAVITTKEQKTGVYVHWCGDVESITGFLDYCKAKGYRPPETDNYGWACLAKVIGNYFVDGLSCGVDDCSELDMFGDNGVYIIKDWKIVDRIRGRDGKLDTETVKAFIRKIDAAQPEKARLTPEEGAKIL